jgi:hypothetical protein
MAGQTAPGGFSTNAEQGNHHLHKPSYWRNADGQFNGVENAWAPWLIHGAITSRKTRARKTCHDEELMLRTANLNVAGWCSDLLI